MLGGNQNAQGLGVAADSHLPPFRFAFDHFIIEPTIGILPTYFDLLAALRSGGGQVFLRTVNPFNKFITLVALEADHVQERIAGVRIMGEWQCRAREWDVKNVDGYQITLPRLSVDIDLEIERLCLGRHLAQGASAAA